MFKETEVVICPSCGVETHHVVVLVRKKSAFEEIRIAVRRIHFWFSKKHCVWCFPCVYG